MTYAKGLHPGATWHKCDFQCHTPRDRGWIGSPHLPGGDEEKEAARNAWAEEFVKAAEAAKLMAIAITDHHDVCFSGYVAAAAAQLGSELKVFPGIEVTCSDASQCLCILDPTCEPEKQKLILAAAGNILPAPAEDEVGQKVENARNTIAAFVEKAAEELHLKDLYVLLPHFSDDDAHKSLNVPQHHPRFANLPIDGVYIERPYGDLDQTTIEKIRGKIPEWGTRRRAILATGDNRNANWGRLGAHDCWIKLGENSVEAIRQALLADEARVTFDVPDTPPERIVKVTIKSSLTGPDPVKISFNDGFTALIGGRGSGKSSILEYLRFGLGRTDRDMDGSSSRSLTPSREAELIDETLQDGGFVQVVLEREGVTETWTRALATQEAIEVAGEAGTTTITPGAARERFRARAFRQKGLSSTMNDPTTAADQITGIAAAEEVDKQREVEQAIRNAKRTVATKLNNLAAYWQATLEHKQARDRVADLKQRLSAITDRLSEEGVSAEHVTIIEAAPKHARARSYLDEVKRVIAEDRERLSELTSSVLPVELTAYEGVDEFEELKQLQSEVVKQRTAVCSELQKALDAVGALTGSFDEADAAYKIRREQFDEAHQKALEEQSRHRNLIDDSTRLTAELESAERSLALAVARESDLASAVKDYDGAVSALDNLIERRREILRTAAEKVAGKSSDLLKARLQTDSKPREYVEGLCTLFEASFTQQVDEGCTEWVCDVLGDTGIGWPALRKAFVEIYQAKIVAGSPTEPTDEIAAALDALIFAGRRALTENQKRRIYANLTDSNVGQILSAAPRDSIVLSYMDEGKAIAFRLASPGQQASALLELLLSQSAGTLIIDQPEDDLDNRVIMRIVKLVRTSKNHRQLVFTTHNPNIVVNGDADKVVALRSADPAPVPNAAIPRVQVDVDGAIETPAVRDAITTVMEGGKEAFDLRTRKYRFEAAA